MIRRLAFVALAAFVLAGGVWTATATGASGNGRGTFLDDDGSVHEADINGLAASGITRGCNPPDNTEFCPTRSVTRAEMASFLVRALDLPPATETHFTDTGETIHHDQIAALAEAGITRGCNPPENTRYCPQEPVTREQMASFLVRALELEPAADGAFTDTSGSVHRADIAALAEADITRGCNPPDNTRFCPRDRVTRQQMASFLVRALDIGQIVNRLSLRDGLRCTKDGLSCSARLTLPRGTKLELVEGWYQVLPYRAGEEAAFKAGGTNVGFAWDGDTLVPEYVGLTDGGSAAQRRWRTRLPDLTSGTHTVRGVWHWDGEPTQTVTFTITVP